MSELAIKNPHRAKEFVLSLILYTLFTNDCCALSPSNLTVKLADDTIVLAVITGNDETLYRREVRRLVSWCSDHNLALNTTKTKKVISDFRRARHPVHTQLLIGGEEEFSSSWAWLWLNTCLGGPTPPLLWERHINIFSQIRKLKKAQLPQGTSTTPQSIMCSPTGYWCGCPSAPRQDKEALHRVVKAVERIIGKSVPEISAVFTSCCLHWVNNILLDQFHLARHLFSGDCPLRRDSSPSAPEPAKWQTACTFMLSDC